MLADLTALDWFPSEPRFEVVYSLLSHERHERIRIKVKVNGADPIYRIGHWIVGRSLAL